MSATAHPAQTTQDSPGFRPGRGPAEYSPDSRLDAIAERLPGDIDVDAIEARSEELVEEIRWEAETHGRWADQKTEAAVGGLERVTGLDRRESLVLNQAQGVIGRAIGIMATLMIGVVVLGKIDGFTLDLTGSWSNTSNSVSEQSQQTFDFLNLVPFLLVALFVLGIMATRM